MLLRRRGMIKGRNENGHKRSRVARRLLLLLLLYVFAGLARVQIEYLIRSAGPLYRIVRAASPKSPARNPLMPHARRRRRRRPNNWMTAGQPHGGRVNARKRSCSDFTDFTVVRVVR